MNAVITGAGCGSVPVDTPSAAPDPDDPGPTPRPRAPTPAREVPGAAVPGPLPAASYAYTLAPEATGPAVAEELDEFGSGTPQRRDIRADAAPVLPDRLELARLLRRLRHFGPAPNSVVVNEEATAEHAALTGMIVPVLEPARERLFELALVVDSSISLVPWQRLLDEFARELTRHGAFRAVRTWTLDTDVDGRARLRTPLGMLCPDAEPAGATGRRIVLVISDGIARAWSDPGTERMIAGWGRRCPVLFVQLLPRRWWDRSRIDFTPVVFKGEGTGPARRLAFRRRRGNTWTRAHEQVAIPVVGLHPDGLRPGDPVDRRAGRWSELSRWARLLTDTGGREFPGAGWVLRSGNEPGCPPADDIANAPADERTPAQRLAEFQAGASPEAVELLGRLAAAPISLATTRIVQSTLPARQDPAFVAEVFLSGLLVAAADSGEDPPPDEAEYDFALGVREMLLARMSRHSALEVYGRVATFVNGRIGRPEFDFRDLLLSPRPAAIGLLSPAGRPLARVGATLLRQLGPGYRGVAHGLDARANGPLLRRRELVHRWTASTRDWIRCAPVVAEGVVLVVDVSGSVVALDALAGTTRWVVELGEPVRCPPVLLGATVWVGGRAGSVHAFAIATGAARRSAITVGEGPVAAMTGMRVTGEVLVATLDGGLAVVGEDMEVVHRLQAGHRTPVGLCADGHRVAIAERTGLVTAMWAGDLGQEYWEHRTAGAVCAAPTHDTERLYVPLATRGIEALRWSDGARMWSVDLDGGVPTTPVLADHLVIAATAEGAVHALDAQTGALAWSTFDEAQPDLRVTVAGAFVYVAGAAGGIRVYDVTTGRRLAEIRSAVGVSLAVDPEGYLVLAGLDGGVTSLEGPVTVG
nr:SAV_2336 N-terminal domain-related protein [Streptomyces sp. SID3343]